MLNAFLRMKNPIMPYAWGSTTAIATLCGQPSPSSEPQAEMWMGAHDKAPSHVYFNEQWQPLNAVIQRHPTKILGNTVVAHYGRKLPFLFKILAARQPLSIQAHPTKKQAVEGFLRENKAGIAMDAAERNYRDDQHKPECICALTSFWGVCGFRSLSAIRLLLATVLPSQYASLFSSRREAAEDQALKLFFSRMMTLPDKQRRDLVKTAIANCRNKAEHFDSKNKECYRWAIMLNERYPDDIGVLSPFLLNLIQLSPGDALFLPAGQLHAYFGGLGLEIMANSDNVLRGALTSKHVDVPELLTVLDFKPHPVTLLKPVAVGIGERRYPSHAEEFALSVIQTTATQAYSSSAASRGFPEILLCTDGAAILSQPNPDSVSVPLKPGDSVLVPAAVETYVINGEATVYKASINC